MRSRPSSAWESLRSATSATTSKYSHQIAAVTATPSTEATTTPASTVVPWAPTPMATIDSPRAMITISPWRSAKWPGTSFHPSTPKKKGPPMSKSRAVTQSAPCSAPSAK